MRVVDCVLHHPTLRAAVQAVPSLEVEWVRSTAFGDQTEMVFWAGDGDYDGFDAALEADPTIALVRSYDVGERRLYQVELEPPGEATDLYPLIVEVGAVVLSARVDSEGWHCRIGFPDESGIDRFFAACREHGISFEIDSLNERTSVGASSSDLTDVQYETIVTAFEAGYFDVPRATTLEEVAEDLGISDAAVSQRIRRGLRNLVERVLTDEDEGRR